MTRQPSAETDDMSMRRFSLAHLTALACPPPELIRIAAKAGYDYVGLRTMPLGLPKEPHYELHIRPELLRETKATLADTGIQVLDLELARIVEDVDPRSYVPALEVAVELGARHILSSIWSTERTLVVDYFALLCDLAKPLGLTVNLEFVSFGAATTLASSLDVVRAAGRDNIGIMIDTLHFHRSRIALDELDSVPREWFYFAHVCDDAKELPRTLDESRRTGREARLYAGEGGVDIAGILNRMPESVICAVELPHLERMRDLGAAEYVRRCLEAMKRYLAEHPRPAVTH